jgi:rhodanese-related sulfurtransferase
MQKFLAMALLSLFTAGCVAAAEGIPSTSVADARAQLQAPSPPLLIDVREPHEYAAGHAPGAVNVPLSQVSRWAETQPKDQPTLVICQSGRRSLNASKTLLELGFTSVTNVAGGTSDWISQGYPVDR